jgi:hypothetical protein
LLVLLVKAFGSEAWVGTKFEPYGIAMRFGMTIRSLMNGVTLVALAAGVASGVAAFAAVGPRRFHQQRVVARTQRERPAPVARQEQPHPVQTQPAPIVRQPPASQPVAVTGVRPPDRIGANPGRVPQQGHLAQWMNQHSNLTPAEQMQALQREPGFHELPQQTQQRYLSRLSELNAMAPQQRQRLLASTEAMEKLTADQRAQVRGAMQQVALLPEDQRRQVQKTFRQLRDLPPDQRGAALNSERYRGQLNPQQMETLRGLMRVEPMLPPPEPRPGQGQMRP